MSSNKTPIPNIAGSGDAELTMRCPVCGEDKALSKLCTVDGFDVERCATCSAEFAFPVPDAKTLKAYYDRREWFEGGERGGYDNYDDQTQWSINWVKDIIENTVGTDQKSVLDIGCGYGTHLQLAADLGWMCFGVEPSNHARAIATERLGGRAYIVETTSELIPHEFDLVLILDTIEHIPSPYELLYSLFSIGAITPNTRVVISTPNAGSADAQRDPAAWPYRHPPSHLVYYTAQSLQHLLRRLHFTSIDVRGTAGAIASDLGAEPGLLVTASGSDFTEFMRERYVPGTWSKIAEYEHVPRYTIALSLVKDKTVLDFGCGTGYGSALLAHAAKSVVGLDIDTAAIEWAKDTHRNAGLTYLCQDDLGASLPAASFDVITCFEMIEHVDHVTQKAVITSFARLLRPDGVLLISTPNPEVTKLYGANPYHIREMDEEQLGELLSPHFPSLQILRQHVRASVSFEDSDSPNVLTPTFFSNSQTPTSGEPLAFIGICSPAKYLAALPASVLFDRDVDYIANFMAAQNTLNRARLEKYQLAETVGNYKGQIAAYATQSAAFKLQIAEQSNSLKTQAAGYEAQSANLKSQIAAYADQAQAFTQQLRDQANAHHEQTNA
jgi:2-polyprenyl-3-methyl-5-hydroxy-6-metoxy-1,4-benzoquinol methylase